LSIKSPLVSIKSQLIFKFAFTVAVIAKYLYSVRN